MNFAFTEEQEELRATARAFLAEHSAPAQVRAAMETELGHDASLWKQIGAELGWTAVAIPEAYGGIGLSWVEVAALQELMGEALFCGPYLATVCLAASAIEICTRSTDSGGTRPLRCAKRMQTRTTAYASPVPAPNRSPRRSSGPVWIMPIPCSKLGWRT